MEIKTATDRNSKFIEELLSVWETSVKSTHHFLMDADVLAIKPQVQQALALIDDLMYVVDKDEGITGFMAVEDSKIEMLFIHPMHRGCGIGKKLIDHAVNILSVSLVDVNEQNIQGVEFYKHMKFRVISRSSQDKNGNPFPILHMGI